MAATAPVEWLRWAPLVRPLLIVADTAGTLSLVSQPRDGMAFASVAQLEALTGPLRALEWLGCCLMVLS